MSTEFNERVKRWTDEYIKMVREGNQMLRILKAIELELACSRKMRG